MNKDEILNDLAPCGLSCRKCFAFRKGEVGKHSQAIKDLLGNFDVYAERFSDFLPPFRDYPAFKRLLTYLASPDCEGCRKGTCKWPDCGVQACYREKGVDFCFECDEFPCKNTNFDEHLQKRWVQMQERIQTVGVAAYYEETKEQPRYRQVFDIHENSGDTHGKQRLQRKRGRDCIIMTTYVEFVESHHEEFNPWCHIKHETVLERMDTVLKTRYPARKSHEYPDDVSAEFAFYDMKVCSRGPMFKPGGLSEYDMMASFNLGPDAGLLFPYLNAVTKHAELHQTPHFIKFLYEDRFCVLYPKAGLISPVEDRSQATAFLKKLIGFLNEISLRRDEITPNHRIHRRVSVLNILKLLPKTNCRKCGYASCMAFAASLSLQESVPEQCPYTLDPLGEQAIYPVYDSEGNLLSTVAININTAKISPRQNGTNESLNPKPKRLPKEEAEKVEKANVSLPMALSTRELEVLCILAEGVSNIEISHMLNISPHTVKSHVTHIFNKLGVNDRTQAAVWAARHHLV